MQIIHCSYVYAGPQQAPTSLQSEFFTVKQTLSFLFAFSGWVCSCLVTSSSCWIKGKTQRTKTVFKFLNFINLRFFYKKTYFRTLELFLTSLLLTFFPTHFFVSQPAPKVGYRISSSSLLINDKMMIESSLTWLLMEMYLACWLKSLNQQRGL